MTVQVQFARPAYRQMITHANQVARDRQTEAIGWLLGYFHGDGVTVLDSIAATRYKSQSRYGAEGDPREELEIATSYPRVVGIVGLYHSHPFRGETQHAIFHSHTDDKTLKSRASRRENYLSVVTDGHDAEVFVLKGGKEAVTPEVLDTLTYRGALRRYTCDISIRLESEVDLAGMEGLLAAVEREVEREIDRALREADAELDTATGTLSVPGFRGKANRNALKVEPRDGRVGVELHVRTEAVVYLPPAEEDEVLAVLKQEIRDDVVFLLWHGVEARALVGPVVGLEANLGSLRVQETNPLPKKLYKASRRALVVKRGSGP